MVKITPTLRSRLVKNNLQHRAALIIIILVVAAIGTYFLVGSHAASPYVSTTAASGTLSNGAVSQTCSGASSGICVAFGSGSSGGGSEGTQTDCFMSPSKCGYPDPTATSGTSVVGPVDSNGTSVACSSLTPSGSITSTSANQSITGLNISGDVLVTSNGVTLKNDCITQSGGGSACTNSTGPATHQCFPLWIESGSASVTNTTITGANASSNSIIGVANSGNSSGTMSHDYIYNCTECIHDSWTVDDSYIISNGSNSAHTEDWYFSDGTVSANDDTMLDPQDNTAIIFGDTNGGQGGPGDNHITTTNSLLAGSGFLFYPDANSSSEGTVSIDIANNRIARCLTSPVYNSGSGGYACSGGADQYGYWPYGGYYGKVGLATTTGGSPYSYTGSNQIWSDNCWDNNRAIVNIDGSAGSGTCTNSGTSD
jgi:hypothetical protein